VFAILKMAFASRPAAACSRETVLCYTSDMQPSSAKSLQSLSPASHLSIALLSSSK
jgi:hypothetical protein